MFSPPIKVQWRHGLDVMQARSHAAFVEQICADGMQAQPHAANSRVIFIQVLNQPETQT